jgi:hypothetical protein
MRNIHVFLDAKLVKSRQEFLLQLKFYHGTYKTVFNLICS